jgi:uncharacterized protein
MWSDGEFYWNELMTRDCARAMTFYGETLGWVFDAMPMETGTYWVAKLGGKPVAGLFDMSAAQFDGIPENWGAFIAVTDVDGRVQKAEALGAALVRPIFETPGAGRIAVLRDPGGAVICWITPSEVSA